MISLKNYILKHLVVAFLVIMAIWAALFYAYLLDEVYDNVDDGLKNQKIEIIRETYENPSILKTNEYGINQFRVFIANKDFNKENRFSREFFYMPYDEEMEPYRVLRTGFYAIDGTPYHLEIRTSTVEEDDLLLDFAIALIVLYIVLVLSVFIINKTIIKKVWKPFNQILDNLNYYEFGNKENFTTIQTNVIEFDRLDKSIRQMWKRNEQVFQQQKTFIENASHELQTPLAITINKLEVLLDDDTLTENQIIQLSQAKDALIRLSGLNKTLLTLSRIENKQYKNIEKVKINDIVRNIYEDFKELLEFKGIVFSLNEKSDFICEINKDLAIILISNLIRNAIKYNKEEGKIEVNIRCSSIEIKNTGENVSLDENNIFQRFYKDEKNTNSNGLGLSIVKSIIDVYPFLSISYKFDNDFHVFTIKKAN